ncbi:MAG: hypothetical protein WCR46_14530 [Deltaproteobacteria bacterium]
MTIRSITVYSDVGPWGDWEPAIREEMTRLGIPYSEKDRIAITILRPLSARPKMKIKDATKSPLK